MQDYLYQRGCGAERDAADGRSIDIKEGGGIESKEERTTTLKPEESEMKTALLTIALILALIDPQPAFSQDRRIGERLEPVSAELVSIGEQLARIESDLLLVIRNQQDSSIDSRKATLTLIMVVESASILSRYEGYLLACAADAPRSKKDTHFPESSERLKAAKEKMESLLGILDSNQTHVEYQPSVMLIEGARGAMKSSIDLLEKSMEVLG
ncbi:MAG: hypothetical protein JXD19_05050 [Deltaproteobacteria bacterium]|nr:hypothetical protein [Deltaproteobacteria bacterium]